MDWLASHLWRSPRRAFATTIALASVLLVLFASAPALRDWSFVVIAAAPFIGLFKLFPNETKLLLARAFGYIAWAGRSIEREATRQDIEGAVSRGATALARGGVPGVATKVRLDFLKDRESVDALPDGTLVLGIADHRNRTRNLIAAAWAFCQHGIVPDARPHLDADVSRALDLVTTKELLLLEGHGAVREYLRTLWDSHVRDAQRLRTLASKLDEIQEQSFLGPFALAEFHDMGLKLSARLPSQDVADESARFVEYLHAVATHEPEQDIVREFNGRVFRCAAFYVKEPDIHAIGSNRPTVHHVQRAIRAGYVTIYLLARGRQVGYLRRVFDGIAEDPRLRGAERHEADVTTAAGVRRPQLICRLTVDWRHVTSIGQRPILAAGSDQEAEVRRELRRVASRTRTRF